MSERPLPHDGVKARLAPSPIAGVGVFATTRIPAGANIFQHDSNPIRWIDEEDLAALTEAERALYEDFAIRRDGRLGCPSSFNLLTVGWYCNEPRPGEAPNARMTEDFRIMAARDIAAGEEVTIDYSSFSEAPAPGA